MRLRAIAVPPAADQPGNYLLVLDDVTHEEAEGLRQAGDSVLEQVHEWGARGLLLFPGRVELDVVADPADTAGLPQLAAWLEGTTRPGTGSA